MINVQFDKENKTISVNGNGFITNGMGVDTVVFDVKQLTDKSRAVVTTENKQDINNEISNQLDKKWDRDDQGNIIIGSTTITKKEQYDNTVQLIRDISMKAYDIIETLYLKEWYSNIPQSNTIPVGNE